MKKNFFYVAAIVAAVILVLVVARSMAKSTSVRTRNDFSPFLSKLVPDSNGVTAVIGFKADIAVARLYKDGQWTDLGLVGDIGKADDLVVDNQVWVITEDDPRAEPGKNRRWAFMSTDGGTTWTKRPQNKTWDK